MKTNTTLLRQIDFGIIIHYTVSNIIQKKKKNQRPFFENKFVLTWLSLTLKQQAISNLSIISTSCFI